eukprot:scpid48174/ scgid29539/ Serum response factor homolog; Protein blistered
MEPQRHYPSQQPQPHQPAHGQYLQFHMEPKPEPTSTLDLSDDATSDSLKHDQQSAGVVAGPHGVHPDLASYEQSLNEMRKTRGRVKIKMEFIENKLRRYTTFSKRKTGIMKKAYELSTLTGTQVMLLVASETGHVYTFATPKLQPMITSDTGKSLIQTCLNSPDLQSSGQQPSRMSSTGYEETELTYCIEEDQKLQDPLSSAMLQSYPTPPPHHASRDNLVASSSSGMPSLTVGMPPLSSMAAPSPHQYPMQSLQAPTPTTPYSITSTMASPVFSYNQSGGLMTDQKPSPIHLSLDDAAAASFAPQAHYLGQPSPALSAAGSSPPGFYSSSHTSAGMSALTPNQLHQQSTNRTPAASAAAHFAASMKQDEYSPRGSPPRSQAQHDQAIVPPATEQLLHGTTTGMPLSSPVSTSGMQGIGGGSAMPFSTTCMGLHDIQASSIPGGMQMPPRLSTLAQ